MKRNNKKGSIRRRLIYVFAATSGIVFLANMFMYYNINKSIGTIDKIYVSNVSLNDLLDSLTDVQNYVYEYLNTKSTDALENYYRSEQTYIDKIGKLKGDISDNEMILMQRNIKSMSQSYLNVIDETVKAKRGRNIEKYKVSYENATLLYDYIGTYINSLNNELFKYNSNNYELLYMSLRYLEIISTVVLIVITFFNLILIVIVTRSITEPLMKLTQAANKIASGNFEVDLVQVDSKDEVEIVTKAFNTMTVSIHQYIIQIKESMELESNMMEKELMMTNHLKDAQLKYLQAQINPHFLFNTLNAGAQLAMMEGADKTCLFIENMASFFRSNMKGFHKDVSIRDEINLVDSYIYILNVRFSGKIHFNKEIDQSLIDVRIPSMILQPVVENAVNYGIRDIDYEGIIRLEVKKEGEFIDIIISDNGSGIDNETIDRIMNAKIEDRDTLKESVISKDSNGIGLGNVINRLRLYYGREEVFNIQSEGLNKGTRVIIHIPVNMNDKMDYESNNDNLLQTDSMSSLGDESNKNDNED